MVLWGQFTPSEPNQIADLWQQFTVPGSPTGMTLRFWHRSWNPSGTSRIDLDLTDASGSTVLKSLGTFAQSAGARTQRTRTLAAGDVAGLGGQTVHLRMRLSQNDPVDLYVDDVSLKVCS